MPWSWLMLMHIGQCKLMIFFIPVIHISHHFNLELGSELLRFHWVHVCKRPFRSPSLDSRRSAFGSCSTQKPCQPCLTFSVCAASPDRRKNPRGSFPSSAVIVTSADNKVFYSNTPSMHMQL